MRQHRTLLTLALVVVAIIGLFMYGRYENGGSVLGMTFVERCLADGNMWHTMSPRRQGVDRGGEPHAGCMTADGANHFSEYEEYQAAMNPGESTVALSPHAYKAGEQETLFFSIRAEDGTVPTLFREHERYLHVIVISRDKGQFSHVHPDDQAGFSLDNVARGDFSVPFTFARGGEYLIAVDYANQLKHESRTFTVHVEGPPQADENIYKTEGTFDGYEVSLNTNALFETQLATLQFTIEKNGVPVTDLEPYLGAAMHVAVVKSDLAAFIHVHGEVHALGSAASVSHAHVPPPEKFGPIIESHVLFPDTGLYTIYAEFKHAGRVIPARFTVRVE